MILTNQYNGMREGFWTLLRWWKMMKVSDNMEDARSFSILEQMGGKSSKSFIKHIPKVPKCPYLAETGISMNIQQWHILLVLKPKFGIEWHGIFCGDPRHMANRGCCWQLMDIHLLPHKMAQLRRWKCPWLMKNMHVVLRSLEISQICSLRWADATLNKAGSTNPKWTCL